MSKGLVKRIGKKIILPLAISGIVGSGCTKYEIDGRKIKDGFFTHSSMTETYDGNKIRYSVKSYDVSILKNVRINGVPFYKKDTIVFSKAQERFTYLTKQIQEIEKQKVEQEREKQLNRALNVLE